MADNSPQKRYSDAQIDEGLQFMANLNGSATKAARELELLGRPTPRDTLQRWKTAHPERYAEARKRASNQVWDGRADASLGLSEDATDAAREAIAASREALRKGDVMDAKRLADMARSHSISSGVSFDKAALADQRPMGAPPQAPDITELIRNLNARFGHVLEVKAEVVEQDKPALPEAEKERKPE